MMLLQRQLAAGRQPVAANPDQLPNDQPRSDQPHSAQLPNDQPHSDPPLENQQPQWVGLIRGCLMS